MVGKRRLRVNDEIDRLVQAPTLPPCPLCNRPMVLGPTTDEHHLIPKSKGGTEKFRLHKICHQKIHTTLDENTLAKHFNTWQALQAHPEIAKFIQWIKKRPADYIDKNRRLKR